MHVLQWIAVEAEDVENAVTTVDQTLESYMSGNDSLSTWYDWYVVGGGRWNSDAQNWKTNRAKNDVIRYDDEPDNFTERVVGNVSLTWDSNSRFYDSHNKTTDPERMNAELGDSENSGYWYLVPVEFDYKIKE